MITIRRLQKYFSEFHALKDIDLSVREGEVIAILGPSGSGKSTLVRCIHQLEPIQGGAIYLGDELLGYERTRSGLRNLSDSAVARQRARMGMVFQQFNLFQHKTVLENLIEGPTQVMGMKRHEAEAQARDLLARVHLSDKADSYPRQLSGGQQQRAAIARAMANRPAVMLFDEPTSALDPELVGEVLEVIREIAATGVTMLIVTHEIRFARDVADRIIFMEDGRIVEDGPTRQIMSAPADTRLGSFLARSM
ncbi:ATP-binding cassette domain-containing protein [Rhodobacterales bacterium HKCCE2091]|nr:ATP-binding cassette domain-containing protein [Rhodobacterales bacterium HKCCE2091]